MKAKEEGILPDLIVIDGGKGHLNIALSILSELDISTVDVIGVAKEQGRHDKGMTAEKVYIASSEEPLQFKSHSAVLFFLQKIRDEAHRFAITFHRQRRSKRSLFSALDEIPGIGPVKKTRLLKHFGSLKRVLAATDQQLLSIPGISQKDVEAIRKLSNPS